MAFNLLHMALRQRTFTPKTKHMGQLMPPITVRIEWCRQRSRQAPTELEADGWQAEADGLRDAVMRRDHIEDYRLCSPEIRERYLLGLQDGIAMLQAARVQQAQSCCYSSNSTSSSPDGTRNTIGR